MPQPRSSSSRSGTSSGGTKRSASAGRGSSAAKRTSTAKSSSAAKGASSAKRSTAAKGAGTTKRAASSRSGASASRGSATTTARKGAGRASAGVDQRVEAAATRVRKLNERIIEAGKEAGETTLTAYEKALKALAASIERGAGRSDVEWVTHLLNTQAKFIRDVTGTWTSAARDALK